MNIEKIANEIVTASQNDIHYERIKIINFMEALANIQKMLKILDDILVKAQIESDIVISKIVETSFGKKVVIEIPIEVKNEKQKTTVIQEIHPLQGVEIVKGSGKEGYIIKVQTMDHYL
jgi:hypothetical protein